MCEIFQIYINFKEVSIQNVSEEVESQEYMLSAELLGFRLQSTNQDDNSIILVDGCYSISQCFILRPETYLDNEDFAFKVFGNSLKVKLSSSKIDTSRRSKGKSAVTESILAEGDIKLLNHFKEFKCRPCEADRHVTLHSENAEITLTYEVKFENPPALQSTLMLSIVDIYNYQLMDDELIEACFKFPFDQNFRTALMYKNDRKSEGTSHLMDDILKEANFQVDVENSSSINHSYENFLALDGLEKFNDLVKTHSKISLELKIGNKMFMTFIDLTIFNHPGICQLSYLAPIYEWNSKVILDKFQHETCFVLDQPITGNKKKKSKNSIQDNESITSIDPLLPVMSNEKCVALKITLKLSHVLHMEPTTEDLFDELNRKFPYIIEIDAADFAVQQSKKDFHCMVQQMANMIEKFIAENSENLNYDELMKKFECFFSSIHFCLKDEFKDVLRTLIGNTFNQEIKTETNHEFKLLMIRVFKELSQKMDEILIERYQKRLSGTKETLDDNTRIWQMEEYFALNDIDKAQKLLENEFNGGLNEQKMKEKAVYLLKLHKYEELECLVKKLLRISKYCTFSLYILFYLFVLKEDDEVSTLILTILTRLKPSSMEYWMLLKHYYGKSGNVPGYKFCEIKIQESRFISNCKHAYSAKYPDMLLLDPIVSIKWNQFKFAMHELMEIIKIYDNSSVDYFEKQFLMIVELIELKEYVKALEVINNIDVDEENEVISRLLKGNILYELNRKWKAVCEYEIAFNLSQKIKLDFPLIPALRCGNWFLNEMENLPKSQKYYHFCCQKFGTYESLMGLGKVSLKLQKFSAAKSFFIKANLIDKNSSENWIFQALTYGKLHQHDMALKCYLTAKKIGIEDTKELIEVEEYLDI